MVLLVMRYMGEKRGVEVVKELAEDKKRPKGDAVKEGGIRKLIGFERMRLTLGRNKMRAKNI